MNSFACYGKKLQRTRLFTWCYYHELIFKINPFFIYIFYFISLSFLGFGILTSLNTRTSFKPRNIDLFFTSVSASTVSSMSTVEMEVFSNAQLLVMTILMFVGGEIFTSMVGIHLKRSKLIRASKNEAKVEFLDTDPNSSPSQPDDSFDHTESGFVTIPDSGLTRLESQNEVSYSFNPFLKYDSMKFLGFLVLAYLVIIHVLGVTSMMVYFTLFSTANNVLRNKGINTFTFSLFTVVSTLASCGYVPTNENMIIFSTNSGLLWILIPQILLGNTLFPSALRFLIWVLGKKVKKVEAKFLLNNTSEVGYLHLLPRLHSMFLVATVFGFILIGFVIFCSLEWNSEGLIELNVYQKIVGIIFQCVNARHTGETIVDLSTIAQAILVFFVVMMYLPPYTSFIPIKRPAETPSLESEGIMKKRRKNIVQNLIFSQLSYLAIFIFLICITERKSLKHDPINFSVLNIIVEVISAYGNVGFTTGYSCERQIREEPNCVNRWYGFSGKWSDNGKIILIIVMIFGRLKKFNMTGGRAWKLL